MKIDSTKIEKFKPEQRYKLSQIIFSDITFILGVIGCDVARDFSFSF